MFKPTKSFRMAGSTKRLLSTIVCPHERGAFKRAMIQAQLASEQMPVREKRPAGGRGGPTDAA